MRVDRQRLAELDLGLVVHLLPLVELSAQIEYFELLVRLGGQRISLVKLLARLLEALEADVYLGEVLHHFAVVRASGQLSLGQGDSLDLLPGVRELNGIG